jgi:ATP-binding cassette subfamily B multidrug efflux pump
MVTALFENEKSTRQEREMGAWAAFSCLVPYLKEHSRRLALCLTLLVGVIASSLAWPKLIQLAIDGPITRQLSTPESQRAFTELLWYGLAIFGLQVMSLVLQYLQYVKLEIIGQDIILSLKRKLFDHILSLDISFFDRNPVGRLMARVESDAESLRLLFTNTVVVVIGDVLLMVGIYAWLFAREWRLALTLLLFMPVIGLLIWIFHRLTTHRFLEVRKRMAEVTASLTEFIQGMSIIQIFHRGEWARQRVWRANEAKFSEDAYVNIAVCIFFNVLFMLEYVKIGLVLVLGVVWSLSPGTIVFFVLMIWKEFDPVARTADQLGSFQKGIAGGRRIFSLLNVKPTLIEPEKPVEWDGLKEGIRFENVWFSYDNDENWVLRDVSFEIPVGKRVALAGVTGGGKTTVINLLLRMYDPQRGRITVDGIDIRRISTAYLRRRFALVLQDIILFPGDVASNIGLENKEISQSAVEAAARTVAAHPVIEKLPEQYRTEVSEKGANFSRGERQLLSFARALAVNPDVLILDEATSSVDPETERTIQTSLKKLMTGRTSLIIAHRLTTILDVDQILVIRRGEIVERGTHTELILQEGYYSKLFHLQFKNRNGVTANA